MYHFFSVNDVPHLPSLLRLALEAKQWPYGQPQLGAQKTLGLIFLNPSLRTRMSTQKAAQHLGLHTIVLNIGQEGWQLETRDGVRMDGKGVEHIREAAGVIGTYCDIVGLRSFPGLTDRAADKAEVIFQQFMTHCRRPVMSLESATRHPLQSLADLLTILEHSTAVWDSQRVDFVWAHRPKVVLAWAPHIKALPQAVPNSFAEWMRVAAQSGWLDFSIAHPKGYSLDPDFVGDTPVSYDLEAGIAGADFVYIKNWSSFEDYGQCPPVKGSWMLTPDLLSAHTRQAKVMHCLPVRRNVELSEAILDGPSSLVLAQAANRVWAAQAVLSSILQTFQRL
ncbi:MAG: acetylornithine carbamoyltransferase [Bernardetiaceae bacterium]